MQLTEPDATPLDIRFRLFGTYVRIHPLFWLMAVLLGWDFTQVHVLSDNGLVELAIWVVCVFVSILLHEFGHVWMGRVFGSHGHILLQGMGGLAMGSSALGRRWKRLLVLAAGPGIQLAFYALILLVFYQGGLRNVPRAVRFAIGLLLIINLYWPLFNLLPIWPLDGGQIAREIFDAIAPRNGVLASLWVSLAVSGTLAVNALVGSQNQGRGFIPSAYAPTSMWMAILFALFAVGSWQAIQAVRHTRERVWEEDALPWER